MSRREISQRGELKPGADVLRDEAPRDTVPYGLVAIGASIGGFEAISTILQGLPDTFEAAIAIVQHRRPDNDSRLEALLSKRSRLPVHVTDDKQPLQPGNVYICPPDYHMLIDGKFLSLSIDEPVSWSRPSIDVLFESAADAPHRPLIGVLLTAGSSDGAAGLAAIAKRGGTTVVQDPREAASPIAPLAAIARTPIDHVIKVAEIAPLLIQLVSAERQRASQRKRRSTSPRND